MVTGAIICSSAMGDEAVEVLDVDEAIASMILNLNGLKQPLI